MGAVNEVLPKDQVLDRAWEHAREIVKRPPLVLRYTRELFTAGLKRVFLDELTHGLGRETYAQRISSRTAAAWSRSTAPGTTTHGHELRGDGPMSLTITPLGPNVGVEVSGLAAEELVTEGHAAECLRLIEQRGVVIYREVGLDDDQLVAFSRMLGEVERPRSGALESHPEVSPVTRKPGLDPMAAYRAGTFFWHLDGANGSVPNKTTLLAAEELSPDDEGDTEFASTYAAYEHLPEDEKRALDGVRVVHSFRATQRLAMPDASDKERALWERVPDAEHPLVWVRRDGRRSMLVGSTTDHVVGMDPEEGRALLDHLLDWATRPEFVVRHHWRRGDLVVWDNTGMLHRALPYGEDSPRLMHRTTIAGEETIA